MLERFTLPNGLVVVAKPQHTAPVAAFQLWVNVGSLDEQAHEVGLAHLHEHLLFKGTPTRGPGEVAGAIERHGGEINAFTSFEHTVYHVVLASAHARLGLDVLADALRRSVFDPLELTREIEVVCEEIKRSHDAPGRRASNLLFSSAYPDHPFGRPVIGFEADVRAHTQSKCLDFFHTHYRPDNVVLVAVGDFSMPALREWVDATLGGDWQRPPRTHTKRVMLNRGALTPTVSLKSDPVKEAHLHLAFAAPAIADPTVSALDVLASLAGQGDGSRLSLEVRRKRNLAKEVSAWAYTPTQPGLFGVSVVATVENIKEAFQQTLAVLQSLKTHPVEASELESVKQAYEAEAVYQAEAVQGQARKLGHAETAGVGYEYEALHLARIAALTPGDIVRAAARTFNFDAAVVTGLLPEGTALTEAEVREMLSAAQTGVGQPLPPLEAGPRPKPVAPKIRPVTQNPLVHRCASGATLIVKEDRSVPLFAVRAAYPGGVRYETAATNGRSALIARTLTRGAGATTAEAVSHLVDAMAGSMGGGAGRSSQSARAEFLSKYEAPGLELFFTTLTQPRFDETEVEREKAQLIADAMAREDRPGAIAVEALANTLFSVHPYRLAPTGQVASLTSLSAADLKRFHAERMRPEQLTMAVVGDVDADAVLRLFEATFGRGSGVLPPAPTILAEPPRATAQRVHRVLEKKQTHVVLGFLGASVSSPFRMALDVLSTVLGGQSGRLFVTLRDEQSLAYSVSASSVEGVDPGWLMLHIATSPEKVPQAIAGLRHELMRMRDETITPAELERAQALLIGSHAIALQRYGAQASVMSLDSMYGLGATHYLSYDDEVRAVTTAHVRAVAQQIINFESEALVLVGPE